MNTVTHSTPRAAAEPLDDARELEDQLRVFEQYAARSEIGGLRVHCRGSHQFVLRPFGGADDPIDLLLMALTHGDEYAGLLVLNAICAALDRGEINERISVGFVLANVAAARRGVRFLDRDMNRCFGRTDRAGSEDRRAREIEATMQLARHSIDLHQTIEPTLTPFFVTAFQARSVSFACAIDAAMPIVTHWGDAFSPSAGAGCTSDEFFQRMDGTGVSIELGQKGFHSLQCDFGTAVCARAISLVAAIARGCQLSELSAVTNPIYSWSEVAPYPPGEVELTPGLKNFQAIAAGQKLGYLDGHPLTASRDGVLLFPKYIDRGQVVKPAELYRLLRRCDLDELIRLDDNDS